MRDLAAEIEWAKARRIGASAYETRAVAEDRDAPLPADLMAGLYRRYETAKARAGRIDFEDMLELTIELIEGDEAIAAEVRDRYRWFSVDEFQDTNPLQAALLETWLGGREDLAVVGDEDQTIYTFTGATQRLPDRVRGAIPVRPDGRARDQLPIDAGGAGVRQPGPRRGPRRRGRTSSRRGAAAAQAAGGQPSVRSGARGHRLRHGRGRARGDHGRDPDAWQPPGPRTARWRSSSARTPQLPAIESALGAAGIPFHVRGERFFARPEVRRAVRVAEALGRSASDEPLGARLAAAFERELGVRRDTEPASGVASERHGAVVTLLELADDLVRTDPAADMAAFLAEVARRTAIEAGGEAAGVELLTYHRAKGLEWDAVFLPALEEGTLPIRQATEPAELAEERRLLYVGITRARRYLWLSWATSRVAASGREGRRSRSRFLDGLVPAGAGRGTSRGDGRDGRTRHEWPVRGAEGRPGRSLAAVQRAPCLAHGPCQGRRRRPVHRLPRHDHRGDRDRRPRSIAELRRVPGVGPTKLDRYGEEIIGVVVREG